MRDPLMEQIIELGEKVFQWHRRQSTRGLTQIIPSTFVNRVKEAKHQARKDAEEIVERWIEEGKL